MAIYTGVADANGDFTVPFSSSYTGAQKITVIAEKNGAQKSIELYAPSEVSGGGVIQFSGTLNDFPQNVGNVTITGLSGTIKSYAFAATGGILGNNIWSSATGLEIKSAIETIESYAFNSWVNSKILILPISVKYIADNAFNTWSGFTGRLSLPDSLLTIGTASFQNWNKCTEVVLGTSLISIGGFGLGNLSSCNSITIKATTPPTITSSTFNGLKSTCIFKVPAGSVAAYQAAPNWSAFAARIQAI